MSLVSEIGEGFTRLSAEVKGKFGKTRIISAQTGSYTLALADSAKMVQVTSASGVNLTVPPNASVAFPVGSFVSLLQAGAGQVTIVAGAGVTVRSAAGLKIASQWGVAELLKIATDEWVAYGRLVT